MQFEFLQKLEYEIKYDDIDFPRLFSSPTYYFLLVTLLYWNWAVGSAIQYPVCHRENHAQSPIKVMYAHKPIYCQLTSIIGFISWYWVFVVYPVGSAELTNKPISKINSKLFKIKFYSLNQIHLWWQCWDEFPLSWCCGTRH